MSGAPPDFNVIFAAEQRVRSGESLDRAARDVGITIRELGRWQRLVAKAERLALLGDDAPHLKVQCGLLAAPTAVLAQTRWLG